MEKVSSAIGCAAFALTRASISILSVFAFLIELAVAQDSGHAETTLDAFFDRGDIGRVISSKDNTIIVEYLRPFSSLNGSFPYQELFFVNDARKTLLHLRAESNGRLEPLFEQEDDVGYFLPTTKVWSDDHRYLLVLSISDGEIRPGVYNKASSSVRFFDLTLADRASARWVSNTTLLVRETREGLRFTPSINASRTLAKVREDGWQNGLVTASMIGGGRYSSPEVLRDRFDFVVLDVETGEVTKRPDLSFGHMYHISPDGTQVAGVIDKKLIDPDEGNCSSETDEQIGFFSTIVQNERRSMCLGKGSRFSGWSGSGKFILTESAISSKSGSTEYLVYEASTLGRVIVMPPSAINPRWIGDNLLFEIRSGSEAEQGWYILISLHSGKPELIQLFEHDVGIDIVGKSGASLLYLSENSLWLLSSHLELKQLTDVPVSAIRQSGWPRSTFFRPWHQSLTSLPRVDFVLLEIEDNEIGTHGVYDVQRSAFRVYSLPTSNFTITGVLQDDLIVLASSFEEGSRLSRFAPANTEIEVPLLRFNAQWIGHEGDPVPVRLSYSDVDGNDLVSWLYLPADYDETRPQKYPLIVVPYPQLVYGSSPPNQSQFTMSVWDTPLTTNMNTAVFTALGYAVLLPSIPLEPFGMPDDPMARIDSSVTVAVDAAIASGYVDLERMAVSGHSYGGYAALTLAAQSGQFQAIIAMAPVANFTSMYGQFSEVERAQQGGAFNNGTRLSRAFESGTFRMGSTPWEDPNRYVRNSPLFFADHIETPVMLIHGDLDRATLFAQSEEMFTALARQGKDVVFVRYWGENHVVDQPQNQRDMWERIFFFLEDNGVTPGGISQ